MKYKAYAKKLDTPSRLARKQARRSVYWYNVKLKKASKKLRFVQGA